MSRSRPTPCEAIAARSSGASAIRSISFCASSESQQAVPDLIDELGVEHLHHGALHRGAGQGALQRVLRRLALEHTDDRPLDRGALERAHDRLLGGALDRVVDPGRRRHPLGAAGADAEQPAGKRRPSLGVAWIGHGCR